MLLIVAAYAKVSTCVNFAHANQLLTSRRLPAETAYPKSRKRPEI